MSTKDSSNELSLVDSIGMSVGGMVGGGIFAVLGVAVTRSGNAAFVSFGLAGCLALITGFSYARLTLSFDEPGGSFSFVEHIVGPRTAGTLSWFLILGYIFTISLYAFTFGEYLTRLIGLEGQFASVSFGGGMIVLLSGLNLVGVRESGWVEDLLVYGKVGILLLLIAVGLLQVDPDQALPVFDRGFSTALEGTALIFVGYEGFQLLTYDYDTIEDKETNFPRAMITSVLGVTLLYMLIAFVTTGTVSPSVVQHHKETVLAEVARPILGRLGFTLVVVAAVVSTASAVNATIFATARLGKRVAEDNQLPEVFMKSLRGGVPVYFTIVVATLAFLIQFTGSLHRITEFSSLVFLVVFGAVNLAALWHDEYPNWARVVPITGCVGCWLSAGALLVSFYRNELTTLYLVTGLVTVIVLLRGSFVLWNRRFRETHG